MVDLLEALRRHKAAMDQLVYSVGRKGVADIDLDYCDDGFIVDGQCCTTMEALQSKLFQRSPELRPKSSPIVISVWTRDGDFKEILKSEATSLVHVDYNQLVSRPHGAAPMCVDIIQRLLDEAVLMGVKLEFDYRAYVDKLADQSSRFIIGYGPPQGGKTSIQSVAWLFAIVWGRPFIHLFCSSIANCKQLSDKMESDMDIFMQTDVAKTELPSLSTQYASKAFDMLNMATSTQRAADILDVISDTRVTYGYTGIIITYTTGQINMIKDKIIKHMRLPGVLISMDEADAFFTNYELNMGTAREKSMKLLLDLHPDVVYKLVSISATPIDVVAWHLKNNLSFSTVYLREEALESSGYTFAKNMIPWNSMIYTMRELKKSSNCWWISEDEDGDDDENDDDDDDDEPKRQMNYKTAAMYNAVRDAQLAGQSNLLLLDICNPRVKATDNVHDRAKRVFTHLRFTDWVVLVCTGEGTTTMKWGERNQDVVVTKVSDERIDVLIDGLQRETRSRPICVMGYHVLNRSVSIRGRDIVPTHMILSISSSTCMATCIQRFGRAQGRGQEVLAANGGNVFVLCTAADWDIVNNYHSFVLDLFSR